MIRVQSIDGWEVLSFDGARVKPTEEALANVLANVVDPSSVSLALLRPTTVSPDALRGRGRYAVTEPHRDTWLTVNCLQALSRLLHDHPDVDPKSTPGKKLLRDVFRHELLVDVAQERWERNSVVRLRSGWLSV